MSTIQIIGLIFLFLVVVVPVLGATLHLVLKPTVDAILRLREALSDQSGTALPESRLVMLEDELRQLRHEVHRLSQAEPYYRELGTIKEPEGAGSPVETEPVLYPFPPERRP